MSHARITGKAFPALVVLSLLGAANVAAQSPVVTAVVNGASFQTNAAVAPGSLISIFGTGLATSTDFAGAFPLPTSLAGASVLIDGIAAPMTYAGPLQINAQVPFEAVAGAGSVTVTAGGVTSAAFPVQIGPTAPAFFGLGGGSWFVNQSGSRNSPTTPGTAGSYVTAYLTGQGQVDNPVATGAPAPLSPLSRPLGTVTATVGGFPAQVLFLGLAPTYAGVSQLNLTIPTLAAGDYPVVVRVGLVSSPPVTISVSAPPVPAGAATSIQLISGDTQTAAPGARLAQPFVVLAKDASGNPVPNAQIAFETGGDASFVGGSVPLNNGTPSIYSNIYVVPTDSSGQATAQYVLGSTPGTYGAYAIVNQGPSQQFVSFRADASNGPDPALLMKIPVGPGPQGISVNEATNQVYTGNNGNNSSCDFISFPGTVNTNNHSFTVIGGATGQTTAVATSNTPIYATPNPVTNRIYVAGTPFLEVFDGSTLQRIAGTAALGNLHQVAIDTALNQIWVNASDISTLFDYDGAQGTVTGTAVTGRAGPHGVGLNQKTKMLYATDLSDNTVTVVDGNSRTVVAQITIGAPALGVAVNSTTNRVYVTTGLYPSSLVVIDGATNTVLARIATQRNMGEVAVDESRNLVYAASTSLPFGFAVFDGATNTLRGFHAANRCPYGVAVNTLTNRVYVSGSADNDVWAFDGAKLP